MAALAAMAGGVHAAPQTFDFKDPKGVNNAVFKLDAPLEAINGSASGIKGSVQFDPAHPEMTKGKIIVESKSLTVPNKMMNEHLHGAMWMDVAKFPEISFDVTQLKNVKTTADTTTADAVGSFTMRGVTKELTVPVKITFLKDKLGARVQNLKGDLLVIRTNFQLKRSDFNVNPGMTDKVSDEIDLSLSIAGMSPR